MGKLRWKREIGEIWPIGHAPRKVVLLYHSVGKTPWGMANSNFQEQMQWLHDNCKVLPLTQLMEAAYCDDLQVAITFDDGYVSLLENVAPKLAARNINAAVYLNTGCIGESESTRIKSCEELGHYPGELFLTWNEIVQLKKLGWEIGSHGVNHYNFTKISLETAQRELLRSKISIEQHLNDSCMHFSYPWGRYSQRVKNLIPQLGYQYAAGACHGGIKPNSDKFAFSRINISNDYTFKDFKNIMIGKWDYLGWIQKIRGL